MKRSRQLIARLRFLEQRLEWARTEIKFQREAERHLHREAMKRELSEEEKFPAGEVTKLNKSAALTRKARNAQSVEALAWSREVRQLKAELEVYVDEERKEREQAYAEHLKKVNGEDK